jgi:hypothetical protein
MEAPFLDEDFEEDPVLKETSKPVHTIVATMTTPVMTVLLSDLVGGIVDFTPGSRASSSSGDEYSM